MKDSIKGTATVRVRDWFVLDWLLVFLVETYVVGFCSFIFADMEMLAFSTAGGKVFTSKILQIGGVEELFIHRRIDILASTPILNHLG